MASEEREHRGRKPPNWYITFGIEEFAGTRGTAEQEPDEVC
jgi:hypothetical protein